MRTRDIMACPVHTVRDTDPLDEAAAILTNKHIAAVPVLGAGGTVVGMIGERDLLGARPGATAADVMDRRVVSVPSEADTGEAAATMLRHDAYSVPVVDDGRLVGIVTRGDLLRTLVPTDDLLRREIQHRLDDYARGEYRWAVHVEGGVALVGGAFDDDTERAVVTVLARTVPGVVGVIVDEPRGEVRACG